MSDHESVDLLSNSIDDGEDVYASFDDGDALDYFEEVNPMSKRRSSTHGKKRRSSFGIARAAINSKNTKKRILSVAAKKAPKSAHSPIGKKKELTIPVTPKLRINQRFQSSKAVQSSEQLLLEKIRIEKTQEMSRINKAHKLYNKLKSNGFHLASSSCRTALPAKKLTIPKGPKSLLDVRLGVRPVTAPKSKSIEIPKKSQAVIGQHTVTVPQPFNFASSKRFSSTHIDNNNNEEVSKPKETFKTVAEIAEMFMKETRTYKPMPAVPVNTHNNYAPTVTIPHSPKLHTAMRPKHVEVESTEDRILAESRNYVFKARPLDKRIFESKGEIGVPKIAAKQSTVPVDFVFRTDTRVRDRQSTTTMPSTVPSNSTTSISTLASASTVRPSTTTSSSTTSSSTTAVRRSVTQPVEFHLSTSNRTERHRQETQDKDKALLAPPQQRRATISGAMASSTTMKSSAEVKTSATATATIHESKPVTVPQSFKLESDLRAKKRQEFDLAMQKRMEENARLLQQCDKRNEDLENAQLASMRRKSVDEGGLLFKAKPIVTKDFYNTNNNNVHKFEPTIPKSPKFLLKERKGSKLNTQVESVALNLRNI